MSFDVDDQTVRESGEKKSIPNPCVGGKSREAVRERKGRKRRKFLGKK